MNSETGGKSEGIEKAIYGTRSSHCDASMGRGR